MEAEGEDAKGVEGQFGDGIGGWGGGRVRRSSLACHQVSGLG